MSEILNMSMIQPSSNGFKLQMSATSDNKINELYSIFCIYVLYHFVSAKKAAFSNVNWLGLCSY